MDTHAIEQRQVQVVHGSLVGIGDVFAPGFAGDQHRKVAVIVAIAIAQAAAIHDERVIEQRAVAIRRGLETAKKIGQLLHVINIDARDVFD